MHSPVLRWIRLWREPWLDHDSREIGNLPLPLKMKIPRAVRAPFQLLGTSLCSGGEERLRDDLPRDLGTSILKVRVGCMSWFVYEDS